MALNPYGKIGKKPGNMDLTTIEKERYSRHILLDEIGEEGQKQLKAARILVIGAGGLGCPALQYLAAAGVGNIGIIDADIISRSNLQRQILYSEQDIGKPKAEVAAKRLQTQNPNIKIQYFTEALSANNAWSLFKDFDLIVEGSDNFSTKYLANDAAVLTGKPLIMASIFKFEGQLSVFNYNNGPTYRCLFPDPAAAESIPTCSEVGVLGVLPGIMGSLMANEVLKIILGIGDILRGRLLKFDTLSLEFQLFRFQKDSSIIIDKLEQISISCPEENALKTISFEEFQQKKELFTLLDVRTDAERKLKSLGGLHIPLSELGKCASEVKKYDNLVVYCAAGSRSSKAVALLQQVYPNKSIFNLKGGINSIQLNQK